MRVWFMYFGSVQCKDSRDTVMAKLKNLLGETLKNFDSFG